MSRVSLKKPLIAFFLNSLEQESSQKLCAEQIESLAAYLENDPHSASVDALVEIVADATAAIVPAPSIFSELRSSGSVSSNFSFTTTEATSVRLSRLQADEDEMALSRTKGNILQYLLSILYLMDRTPVNKSERFFLDISPQLGLERYRHFLRISPGALRQLTALIETHSIFHDAGVFEQARIQKQLAVALRRFGRIFFGRVSNFYSTDVRYWRGNGSAIHATYLHRLNGDLVEESHCLARSCGADTNDAACEREVP
jgi:hypothetical protein